MPKVKLLYCRHMSLDAGIVVFLNGFIGASPVLDFMLLFLASYLPYLLVVAFALLLYLSSYSVREKLYIGGVALISALVARFGATEIIRFFYHRPRPFMAYDLHTLFTDYSWSFPSGHATFFFAMSVAIYLYDKKWGVGFFIATLAVTISRVVVGVHYPSDILGGMLVGTLVAYVTFSTVERWRANKSVQQNK